MRSRFRRELASLIVLAGIVCYGGPSGHAQERSVDPPWGNPVAGLAVGLESERATYAEGERMPFTIRVQNVSENALRVHDLDHTWFYNVTFEAADGGESFWGGSRLHVDYAEPANIDLGPGQVWSKSIVLHDDAREFLRILPNRKPGDDWDYRTVLPAGRYRVSIRLERPTDRKTAEGPPFWKGTAASNVLALTIAPEPGASVVQSVADVEALSPETVAVRAPNLDDVGLAALAKLGGVRSIDASYSRRITDAGLITLENLLDMRDLDLNFCHGITDEGLKVLAGMGALTRLALVDTGITDEGLRHLQHCPLLESLAVGNSSYVFDADRSNRIGDAGLARLSQLERLRKLDLSWCDAITPEGLRSLAGLANLADLGLHGIDVADEGIGILATLPALERLDCSDDDALTDEGLKHLSTAKKLAWLDLSGCGKITDAGIALLQRSTSLKTVRLRSCRGVTAAAVERLQAALPGCTIERDAEGKSGGRR